MAFWLQEQQMGIWLIIWNRKENFLDTRKIIECNQYGRNLNYHSPFCFWTRITLKKMNKMNLKCFYFILFIFFSVILVQKTEWTVWYAYTWCLINDWSILKWGSYLLNIPYQPALHLLILMAFCLLHLSIWLILK